jgi:hypothetical protein
MRGLSKKLESLQASFGIAKKQGDGVSQIVAEFESAIDLASGPIEDVVTLAVCYMCTESSIGKEVYAVDLLEMAFGRSSINQGARFWLAYSYLLWPYYSSEHQYDEGQGVLKAYELLRGIERSDTQAFSASRLLLGKMEEGEKRIKLLEESVALCPEWVRNRISLAKAYNASGLSANALSQFEFACAQCKPMQLPIETPAHIVNQYFGDIISGVYWSNLKCHLFFEQSDLLY